MTKNSGVSCPSHGTRITFTNHGIKWVNTTTTKAKYNIFQGRAIARRISYMKGQASK